MNIKPNPIKDQFFLEDLSILKKIVGFADLNRDDVVLEVGAGTGNLTKELAKKAGKVIAVEIDPQFKLDLDKMPGNVKVRIEDAHLTAAGGGKFRKKKEYNKIVSNIPYSIGEWFLHNLAFVVYDKCILLVAKKFAKSIKVNPIFSSFYRVEEKLEVPKNKFSPAPKTDSVVIDLIKLPDPIETRNLALYLRQYMYQREEWKAKNALREGLIAYSREVFGKKLTKTLAREIIRNSAISEELLEKQPDNKEIYEAVCVLSLYDKI